MNMPVVTALYAGLLGLLSIAIASVATVTRTRLKIAVGDGDNREMLLAMRRHANFVEWTPFALLLIALLEMNIALKTPIHILGAVLFISRLAHALSLREDTMKGTGRLLGTVGTVAVTAVASAWLIFAFCVRTM